MADTVGMVVVGDGVAVRDLATYAGALRESGLFAQNHGRYLLNSRAMEILEGEPPAARTTVIARFDNKAAFDAFWFSDKYQQEVKPLRAHLPTMNVGLWRLRESESVPGAAAAYHCPPDESPVLLMATAPKVDTTRWAHYTNALQSTQLIQRHGGTPILFGAPLAVVEGAYPADSITIALRFPCAKAARDFWHSDAYGEVRKHRERAGAIVAGIWKLLPDELGRAPDR
jgi:uncharacterized protein (DUF1330 family)